MNDLSPGEGFAGGAPIDIAHLSRHTAGDRRLGREVLGIFRDQSGEYLAALEGAADTATLRRAAHTLKGAASAIGATRLAHLAANAEEAEISAGKDRPLAAIRQALCEAQRFIDFQLLDAAH